MPTFSNDPPDDTGTNNLQILRTPPSGSLHAIIASSDLVGTATHFWNGRTIPHEQDDCEACNNKISWRWHSYIVIQRQPDQQLFLLELTRQATDPLIEYRRHHESLRRAHIRTSRRGDRKNGRVTVEIGNTASALVHLKHAPDTVEILCNLWGIDRTRVDRSQVRDQKPALFVDADTDAVNDEPPPPNPKPHDGHPATTPTFHHAGPYPPPTPTSATHAARTVAPRTEEYINAVKELDNHKKKGSN